MKRIFSLKAIPVAAALLAAAVATGCTMKSQEAPPLTGPSEYGTGITVTATPDAITRDGASQSLITVSAFDSNGRPLRNLSLRTELFDTNGSRVDFGSLSARNIVTDANGRATLVYTAPPALSGPSVDNPITTVSVAVTPLGTNFDNETPRLTTIRLVPPGIVVPPDGLVPRFTVSPNTPTDHQDVFFDASTSTSPANNPIVLYTWDFGDGTSGSGRQQTHRYDNAGLYRVTLTITDGFGRSAQTSNNVSVSAGTAPTAVFVFSPLIPHQNQSISFNASASTAGVPGRHIRSYTWDFGDGSPDQLQTTGSAITSHTFTKVGTFRVTLVVTDDAGTSSRGATTDVPVIP